jgi:hypothetical protein
MVEQFEAALRLAGGRIAEGIANFLPGALVFVVLLFVALVFAVVLRYALQRALTGLDFDRRAELFGISLATWTPSGSATALIASAAYWTVLAIGLLVGLTALDAALPSQFAVSVLQYVPHLLAAFLILIAGGVVARFLAHAVLVGAVNMGMQGARVLSLLVKWLVLIVAAAMALDHIGIGRTVLLLAFGILFGGVVLAGSLAVGLGARDAVSRALEQTRREQKRDDKLDHV